MHRELYFARYDARNGLVTGGNLPTPFRKRQAHASLTRASAWSGCSGNRPRQHRSYLERLRGHDARFLPRMHQLGPAGFAWAGAMAALWAFRSRSAMNCPRRCTSTAEADLGAAVRPSQYRFPRTDSAQACAADADGLSAPRRPRDRLALRLQRHFLSPHPEEPRPSFRAASAKDGMRRCADGSRRTSAAQGRCRRAPHHEGVNVPLQRFLARSVLTPAMTLRVAGRDSPPGNGGQQRPRVGVLRLAEDLRRSARASTTSPSFITATRSQTCAATRRSWVMKTIERPSRSRRSASSCSTCACTETSSAETGSSATSTSGSQRQRAGQADALALAAGEFVRVAVGRRRDRARPARTAPARGQRLRARHAVDDRPLRDQLAGLAARIERGERVLEHHLDMARLRRAAPRASGWPRSMPSSRICAAIRIEQPHDAARQRRLAGAGFADDAERRAARQRRATRP